MISDTMIMIIALLILLLLMVYRTFKPAY